MTTWIFSFSPVFEAPPISYAVEGDTLTVDGEAFDLSPLPEGGILPQAALDCPWLLSPVVRTDGAIHLTVLLPHGLNAPEDTRFPVPLEVTEDGPLALPPYSAPELEDAE